MLALDPSAASVYDRDMTPVGSVRLGHPRIIAPRLINMQGQTSGMGSGIAAGLSVVAIAEILAIATAAARFLARRTTRISDSAYLRSPGRPRPDAKITVR